MATQLPIDTRLNQAARTADLMELNPAGVTVKQINEACDPGSATKLISVMRREMGYSIKSIHTNTACNWDTKSRRTTFYILLARPQEIQKSLF